MKSESRVELKYFAMHKTETEISILGRSISKWERNYTYLQFHNSSFAQHISVGACIHSVLVVVTGNL